MPNRPRTLFLPGLALTLAGLFGITGGCGGSDGPPTAHLQGTITIAGQPLPDDADAQITFAPASKDQGKPATAVIKGGKYDAPNVPKGPVKAVFSIMQASGPAVDTGRGMSQGMKSIVPAKSAAGLDVTVDGDNAAQDFNLE